MADNNLAFSKVVANPTPNAWSQAYSAGKLFAALSLESTAAEPTDDLAKIGKDIISTLESEFFTIEAKDLESIKGAVETTIARVGENVKPSFIVCYLSDNVLYLYAIGGGKAVLKRGEKIGTVLEGDTSGNVKSASGYVQDGDSIVLQTSQFQKIISTSTLASSMDKSTPDEISEELAPHIHERIEGGAAAVILVYKIGAFEDVPVAAVVATTEEEKPEDESLGEAIEEQSTPPLDTPTLIETNETVEEIDPLQPHSVETVETITAEPLNEEKTPEPTPTNMGDEFRNLSVPKEPAFSQINQSMSNTNPENIRPFENQPPPHFSNPEFTAKEDTKEEIQESPFLTDIPRSRRKLGMGFKLSSLKGARGLSKSRKIIAIVAGLLVLIIIIAIVFAVITKGSKDDQAKFDAVYSEANDKYNEGISLKDLNAPLAQESFQDAQNLLNTNKDTFKEGSDEDNQIEDLLSKVNAELGESSGGSTGGGNQATEASKSDSKLLAAEIDNSGTAFSQNDDFIYYIDSKGVTKIDKGNDKSESIIDKDWKNAGGIGTFGSNVYVLDKSDNVLKFAPSGSDFTKSDYFSTAPDFSNSVDMAIDGSVYVLNKDGSIKKYTRGKEDAFEVSGLSRALSNPTKIYTNENTDNLYILDNGNSRVVIMDKDGKFLSEYSADIIKNAKGLDVNESAKNLFILSGDKIYKIVLK